MAKIKTIESLLRGISMLTFFLIFFIFLFFESFLRKYYTRVFKTPKGKVVYGGGGIFPDVFIPMDTLGSSWYFTDLRYTPSFQNFAFDFVANKRNHWKSLNLFLKDIISNA